MSIDTEVKKRAFDLLRAKGASHAVIEFSGGHDEGDISSITLFVPAAAEGIEPVAVDFPTPYENHKTEDDGWLAETLCIPIDQTYYSFAGEFYVNGKVTWDVAKETVSLDADETVENYEPVHSDW